MMGVIDLPKTKIDELTNYFEPNHQFFLDNSHNLVQLIDTENTSPIQVTEIIISNILK